MASTACRLYARVIGLLLVLTACTPISPAQTPVSLEPLAAPYGPAVQVGYLSNERLSETSGMVASRRNAGLLWAVNDSGNGAYLYAVATDGSDRGRVRLLAAENVDWEDLAAFRYEDRDFLVVADVGDNGARRDHCVLYILPEPAVPENGFDDEAAVRWERRIVYRYADGPRDCESVAVDPQQRKIFLLTKRLDPPQLYELPLLPDTENRQVAQKIAHLPRLTETAARVPATLLSGGGPYSHQPTAMDFSANRSRALVLTYGGAYLFLRRESELWPAALSRAPQPIALPQLHQAEAACFAFPTGELYVTSERRPAPLYRLAPIEPAWSNQNVSAGKNRSPSQSSVAVLVPSQLPLDSL